jgi:hypothetical protein
MLDPMHPQVPINDHHVVRRKLEGRNTQYRQANRHMRVRHGTSRSRSRHTVAARQLLAACCMQAWPGEAVRAAGSTRQSKGVARQVSSAKADERRRQQLQLTCVYTMALAEGTLPLLPAPRGTAAPTSSSRFSRCTHLVLLVWIQSGCHSPA